MLQLRQLNLHLAFARARALGEDIEDQRGTIEYLAVEKLFEVSGLGGTEFVIKNHGVHLALFAALGEFRGLAFADEGGGVGAVNFLRAFPDDRCARGPGQLGQFVQ